MLQTDADVAFSGALLQDYLLPVLSNDLIDTYLEFVQNREGLPETLCEFEYSHFKWDHALAGACLAHRWNLPDELVCCILYHHSGLRILAHPQLGRTAVAAVALSAMLPEQTATAFPRSRIALEIAAEVAGVSPGKHRPKGRSAARGDEPRRAERLPAFPPLRLHGRRAGSLPGRLAQSDLRGLTTGGHRGRAKTDLPRTGKVSKCLETPSRGR